MPKNSQTRRLVLFGWLSKCEHLHGKIDRLSQASRPNGRLCVRGIRYDQWLQLAWHESEQSMAFSPTKIIPPVSMRVCVSMVCLPAALHGHDSKEADAIPVCSPVWLWILVERCLPVFSFVIASKLYVCARFSQSGKAALPTNPRRTGCECSAVWK